MTRVKKFERLGAEVLRCFDGNGSVRLYSADEGAHLLEFISGPSLKSLVEQGNDAEATEVICQVVEKIHAYAGPVPPLLESLETTFSSLFKKSKEDNVESIFKIGAGVAQKLIESSQDIRVLHGDIHHENILWHPERGWVLIDPQCLIGEWAYDLSNCFFNPNGMLSMVASSERILSLCKIFSKRLHISEKRILEFAFSCGCLRACWCMEDGQKPEEALLISKIIYDVLQSD